MKEITMFTMVSSLLLLGCGVEEGVDEGEEPTTAEVEEVEEEEDWEDAVGDIDFDEEELEEIPWEEIHLTKGQFDDFLDELSKDTFELEDEEEEMDFELDVKDIEFDGQTIEFTLTAIDEEDMMAEISQAMFIFILDGYSRQFYQSSDYSDGETHPMIIFYDENGTVITENDDFIEFEGEEQE